MNGRVTFTYKNGCIINGNIKDQETKDKLALKIEKILYNLIQEVESRSMVNCVK